MLTYKATYKFLPDGVHGEVLDFPGVIACASDLASVRESLAGTLADMAETTLMLGEALPVANVALHDPESDLEEPIHL